MHGNFLFVLFCLCFDFFWGGGPGGGGGGLVQAFLSFHLTITFVSNILKRRLSYVCSTLRRRDLAVWMTRSNDNETCLKAKHDGFPCNFYLQDCILRGDKW